MPDIKQELAHTAPDIEVVRTEKMLSKHYIGDRIVVKGESYVVTANYPRHGYLFGLPNRLGRGQKSVKIYYGETD